MIPFSASSLRISSCFILYLYVREGYNAFNDFNFLKKEVEIWEIKAARRIRLNPKSRKKQKKTKKRKNKGSFQFSEIAVR